MAVIGGDTSPLSFQIGALLELYRFPQVIWKSPSPLAHVMEEIVGMLENSVPQHLTFKKMGRVSILP